MTLQVPKPDWCTQDVYEAAISASGGFKIIESVVLAICRVGMEQRQRPDVDDAEKRYAVIVDSKEALTDADVPNKVMTKEGERFWATIEREGWVEATSVSFKEGLIPADVKTWETENAAEEFAKRWKGHPWWCVPNGSYEIVELLPNMVLVQKGWVRPPSIPSQKTL